MGFITEDVIVGLSITGDVNCRSNYLARKLSSNICLLVKIKGKGKGKGKAVPLQAWSGPEGSRKLKFPDFMTTAQEGGKFVSLTHRPQLPPANPPGTHFC